jgi:hypothetical protein
MAIGAAVVLFILADAFHSHRRNRRIKSTV